MGYLPTITESRFRIKESIMYCGLFIYNDDLQLTIYNKICLKNLQRTFKEFGVLTSIIVASLIIGSANPTYVFYRDGIFYTLTGVLIPFVEKNSNLETILNIISQLYTASVALIGLVTVQVCCRLFIDTINITTDLCIQEMINLSNDLERGHLSQDQICMRLIKIFRQIQRMDQ